MTTSSDSTVPLTVSYQLNPVDPEDGIIYATILLIALYTLIIFEVYASAVSSPVDIEMY